MGSVQPPSGSNSAPVISGQAQASVRVGEPYSFQPLASDADGDSLQFSATHLPAWASFDTLNGRLSGTPDAANVGHYPGITISVTDGKAVTSLAPFAIAVTQISGGVATISWVPPTMNIDGTVLTDLGGYRIRYGRRHSELDQFVMITNPAINSYVIDNLSSGTWYFAVISINSRGIESVPSSVASKTI
jgi:hypothetical protein